MFESDDFDEVLSQFDFSGEDNSRVQPNVSKKVIPEKLHQENKIPIPNSTVNFLSDDNHSSNIKPLDIITNVNSVMLERKFESPKHTKRKIINSFFDHKNKRKFPGPAGLLSENLEQPKDEAVCHMELFSQDIDSSQSNLTRGMFESSLWSRLLEDVREWNLGNVDTIKCIKQQAMSGNLRKRKAQTVTAFVEAIDRSDKDPLIILRDDTGVIKGTLHRDAWSAFSHYIASECCAIVLWKPTVLTTGSAFKKHYLNITISNIFAIYCLAVIREEDCQLPEGYVKQCQENITIIKKERCLSNTGTEQNLEYTSANCADDIFDDGLDNIFSSDIF